MQRINFTETTLTTLKRNANCSFANAVYKLGIKAQQGLKCDDLFKKSVLMNEVNKLLCKYKLDECISFHPAQEAGISTWYFGVGDVSPDIITYYLNIDGVVTLIGRGTDLAEISIDINANTETTGVSAELSEDGNYMTIYSPPGCFVRTDLTGVKDPAGTIPATQIVFLAGKCPQEETCVEYLEEDLNCITPADLQVLYEFTHKYKETLAKSTKKLTNQYTSTQSTSSSDCCNWGSIGGSIGNQSDLVAYLNTIEKNLITVYDEATEITGDLKSLKFLGAGVTATNSAGEVSVTIPGGGGGSTTLMTDISNADLQNAITNSLITKGVIYRVTDAIEGVVQVIGRSINSVTKAAYREGKSDTTLISVIGIYGTYNPTTNTFIEQGRTATQPTVNEDITHGYYVGQELKTLDTGITYKCTDSTNGAAVWAQIVANTLQQVLDTGNTSTTELIITDGVGNSNTIQPNQIKIANPTNYGTIDALDLLANVVFKLPNKAAGNETFAMLSDITGGATNLGYTPSPTNGIVTSDTGTDATLPLADATNAGLLKPAKYTVLENTSGTNSGNETAATIGAIVNGATNYTTPLDADKVGIWDTLNSLYKAVTWANIKATLKTYFDTLYAPISSVNTYTVQCSAATLAAIADATSYHIGINPAFTWSGSDARRAFKFTQAGTVKNVSIALEQTNNASNEPVTLYLRNVTTATDDLIGTFTSDFGASTTYKALFSSLSITVNASDDYTFKILTPTWTTNPTQYNLSSIISVET